MFGLNITADFEKLTVCPEQSSYRDKIFRKWVEFSSATYKITNESSMNKR
jgi:hypothetical protein